MRVLVCGSRGWTDYDRIERRLRELRPSLVIHGGAEGADQLAERACGALCIDSSIHKPQYAVHHGRAPLVRNEAMLDREPDLVVAFWDGTSTGTAHTLAEARKRGLRTEVNVS